jgi:DNA processing protein
VPLNAESPELGWWLTLHHVPHAGNSARLELLRAFGSIDALFAASAHDLTRILPDKPDAIAALSAGPDADQLATLRTWLTQDASRHFVVFTDVDYPALLREIPDPPLALYVIGDRSCLAQSQLAIVGSRNPTPAGLENARQFAHNFAQSGLVITSGLALGVDGAAHRGALEAGGATIAVCGTGLDRIYPARHRDLAHAIVRSGALISEFALGTPPRPQHFPIRNRLISGLSLGVLVIEAALESGSLITARLALEQGRDVFAIPGSIHSPNARGCHALIRQGAKLVETAQDVTEELTALAQFTQTAIRNEPVPNVPDLSTDAAHVFECLGHDPATLDALVERSGLTAGVVSSMLVALELRGLIAAMPGGQFQRLPGQRLSG